MCLIVSVFFILELSVVIPIIVVACFVAIGILSFLAWQYYRRKRNTLPPPLPAGRKWSNDDIDRDVPRLGTLGRAYKQVPSSPIPKSILLENGDSLTQNMFKFDRSKIEKVRWDIATYSFIRKHCAPYILKFKWLVIDTY